MAVEEGAIDVQSDKANWHLSSLPELAGERSGGWQLRQQGLHEEARRESGLRCFSC